ncbi:hypothetical protein B0H12DRAFT_1108265 [Mycena haematopus]|nr:hypothetical protein B0H12DRAFT_1108265 [Mycena haematopus]
MPRVCRKGVRSSDDDGFVKLSSRVVATDAGKWKMNVFNPQTRQQVNLPIQVKIGNGCVNRLVISECGISCRFCSKDQTRRIDRSGPGKDCRTLPIQNLAAHMFRARAGNFAVFPCHHTHYGPPNGTPPMMHIWIKVGRPGVPVFYQLVRE